MDSLKKDFNWDEVGSVKSGFSVSICSATKPPTITRFL